MPLPGIVRRLATGRPADTAIDVLERLLPGRPDHLAVLTFHRVTEARPGVTPGLLSATPQGFSELLDGISRRHEIVDAATVVRRAAGGRALPRRALLLTVDDAYADFAEHAWPALRARGLPAVLFVPTAYPDRPERGFWWDRLHRAVLGSTRDSVSAGGREMALGSPGERAAAYRALRGELKGMDHDAMLNRVDELVGALVSAEAPPDSRDAVLGWDALRRLAAEGVTLAPHTRSHPLLPRLDPSRLNDEIAGSRHDLTEATGAREPVFAYPSGAISRAVARCVAQAGFRVAFTTRRGVNELRAADWLALRRINVGVGTPPSLVRAQAIR
jgi:peptidoglycan/xylan/chitin deacetylase (PgdA/CDA1 family)